MAKRYLALDVNGNLGWCVCPPELRGNGRCNHIAHQMEGETVDHFIERIEKTNNETKLDSNDDNYSTSDIDVNSIPEITQEEIDNMAKRIDDIAGCHITTENFKEVLSNLPPEKVGEIAKIGFNAAPVFSLPIRDEEYEDQNVKNKLYFTNLHKYGVGGSDSAMQQMFDRVGKTPVHNGELVDIEHSYEEGLTPEEYFAKQFYARTAMITKGVGTAKPGFCIHMDSIVEVYDEYDREITYMTWSDVEVGMMFKDGAGDLSTVEEIQDVVYKPCLEFKLEEHKPIIVSTDHLIMAEIISNNKCINSRLTHSQQCRETIGLTSPDSINWISAYDIFNFYKNGAEIHIFNSDGEKLISIKEYKNLEPQPTRCISTDIGYYETNGLIHHNTARKLFYSFSDTQVMHDCGGPYIDAMHCKLPNGHVCIYCAHATAGGQSVKEGQLIGGVISTRLSEGLTQASMEMKHTGTITSMNKAGSADNIMNALDGWSTSDIIKKMTKANTTEERRQILYEGLKQEYKNANIRIDDFNLQMIARKLTSYKRDGGGVRPVEDNECCDIVSMLAVGNGNNIFKKLELKTGYKEVTKPLKQRINTDAVNQIIG